MNCSGKGQRCLLRTAAASKASGVCTSLPALAQRRIVCQKSSGIAEYYPSDFSQMDKRNVNYVFDY